MPQSIGHQSHGTWAKLTFGQSIKTPTATKRNYNLVTWLRVAKPIIQKPVTIKHSFVHSYAAFINASPDNYSAVLPAQLQWKISVFKCLWKVHDGPTTKKSDIALSRCRQNEQVHPEQINQDFSCQPNVKWGKQSLQSTKGAVSNWQYQSQIKILNSACWENKLTCYDCLTCYEC